MTLNSGNKVRGFIDCNAKTSTFIRHQKPTKLKIYSIKIQNCWEKSFARRLNVRTGSP